MKECDYQNRIIDYLENSLTADRRRDFEAHLEDCLSCTAEIQRMRNLYGLLSEDPVVAPEPGFWRAIHDRVRSEAAETRPIPIRMRRFAWWKLTPVLAPILAVLAIFIFHPSNQKTVAIPVSLDNVIRDTNLDPLMLGRIVDDNLVKSMDRIEPYYETELDEVITDLNDKEKGELIKKITEQYVGKI